MGPTGIARDAVMNNPYNQIINWICCQCVSCPLLKAAYLSLMLSFARVAPC